MTLTAATLFLLTLSAPPAPRDLVLLPPRAVLSAPMLRQQLLVEKRESGEYLGDVTARAVFSSSNPRAATVSRDGLVTALANGVTKITARVGNRTAQATITVKALSPAGRDPPAASRWLFRNHVISVLSRAGCNSGACHGATAGKSGFRLTLRGFDPYADYFVMTRQAKGRRISLTDPGQSLVLLKPSAAIAHGGGLRLDPASLEYRVVRDWIAQGVPPPSSSDCYLVRLEVYPPAALLRAADHQRLSVLGWYSDGHSEDVTRWVKFGTTDSSVASVDESGMVTVTGSGEAAVTIWYLSRVAFATITVPFR